jgi:hypothetical protein
VCNIRTQRRKESILGKEGKEEQKSPVKERKKRKSPKFKKRK